MSDAWRIERRSARLQKLGTLRRRRPRRVRPVELTNGAQAGIGRRALRLAPCPFATLSGGAPLRQTRRLRPQRRLRCSQPGDRHAERRAGYVIQPGRLTEVDPTRGATVL